jgi:ABC-type uncharacterized transport system auxiliary subunit
MIFLTKKQIKHLINVECDKRIQFFSAEFARYTDLLAATYEHHGKFVERILQNIENSYKKSEADRQEIQANQALKIASIEYTVNLINQSNQTKGRQDVTRRNKDTTTTKE